MFVSQNKHVSLLSLSIAGELRKGGKGKSRGGKGEAEVMIAGLQQVGESPTAACISIRH